MCECVPRRAFVRVHDGRTGCRDPVLTAALLTPTQLLPALLGPASLREMLHCLLDLPLLCLVMERMHPLPPAVDAPPGALAGAAAAAGAAGGSAATAGPEAASSGAAARLSGRDVLVTFITRGTAYDVAVTDSTLEASAEGGDAAAGAAEGDYTQLGPWVTEYLAPGAGLRGSPWQDPGAPSVAALCRRVRTPPALTLCVQRASVQPCARRQSA